MTDILEQGTAFDRSASGDDSHDGPALSIVQGKAVWEEASWALNEARAYLIMREETTQAKNVCATLGQLAAEIDFTLHRYDAVGATGYAPQMLNRMRQQVSHILGVGVHNARETDCR